MKKKFVFVIIILLLLSSVSVLYVKKNNIGKNTTKELINISKLSDQFMDDYFEDVKELNEEGNLDHILIVISKRDIKDGHGASKVIKAPNNQYIVQYDSKEAKEAAENEFKNDSYVLSVEENIQYELANDNNSSSSYNSWGIEAMGLNTMMENMNVDDLEEVTVAIIDTGLDVDLFNKYFNGRIKEVKSVVGDAMYDDNGHGTHIAGTIAEGTPDNVKILPVKQTDVSSIEEINILAAINWVVYNHKADVVNMSFGGSQMREAFYQTLEAAKQSNIICLAAAGNNNSSSLFYPASYDNTISIASVDSGLNKSDFSNYGSTVSFAAPGTGIKSIMRSTTQISQQNIVDGKDDQDDEFETISGTSMATPHAVCAAALLKSFDKNLSTDDVIALFQSHSIDLGEDGWDQYFGYGFIDFSGATLCDGTNCDEYNIFKNTGNIKRVDVGEGTYESLYNYGSEMNLLEMQADICYSDDKCITKDLGELKDLVIENYDPYLEGLQEVTIKYKGFEITKNVNNHITEGWFYYHGMYDEDGHYIDLDKEIQLYDILPEENPPKYVIVPESFNDEAIVSISNNVFMQKTNMKTIKILAKITSLYYAEFNNCNSLTSIELPDTLTKIGSYAFSETPSLGSIDLPEGLTEMGEQAFRHSGLYSITIPSGVKTIPESAFEYCDNLQEVIISEGVEKIEDKAFYTSFNLKSISIPKTITEMGDNVFGKDYALENIDIDEENAVYENKEESNTIVEKETKVLLFANELSTIPEYVHILGPYSINGYNYIIPEGITRLQEYALYNMDSSIVVFPRSIDTVDSTLAVDRQWPSNLVHQDSYIHEYLEENELPYGLIETAEVDFSSETEFEAFEKADNGIYYIGIHFKDDAEADESVVGYAIYNDWTGKTYSVSYQNDNESFRYGDEYFVLGFDDPLLGTHYSEKVYVTVEKATPTYTQPTGLSIEQGKALSTLALPEGFSWKEPNTIADELGVHTYLVTYTPEDTTNYIVIEDIEVDVEVIESTAKQVINPTITISDKTYDGTANIDSINVVVSNLQAGEYTLVKVSSKNVNVGEGTAYVTLRLSDDKFNHYTFEGDVQEKEFVISYNIVPLKINKPLDLDYEYTYDGTEKTFVIDGYDSNTMTISDNTGTDAGSYTVRIDLKNKNYIWNDDTTDTIKITVEIKPATLAVTDLSKDVEVEYDGEGHSITLDLEYPTGTKITFADTNGNYTLSELPKYTEVGVYVVQYKLYLDKNHTEYFGSKTLTIIGGTVTITFHSNNKPEETIIQEVDKGTNTALRKNTFTDDKYTFKEWNTSPDGKGIIYGDEAIVKLNRNLDLYAIWVQEIDYAVHGYTINPGFQLIEGIQAGTTFDNFVSHFEVGYNYGVDVDTVQVDEERLVYTGGKTTIKKGTEIYAQFTNVVRGDPEGDGEINSGDLLAVRLHLLKMQTLTGAYFQAADTDEDEELTSADLLAIRLHLIGIANIG